MLHEKFADESASRTGFAKDRCVRTLRVLQQVDVAGGKSNPLLADGHYLWVIAWQEKIVACHHGCDSVII
jgi:hypothetical protein